LENWKIKTVAVLLIAESAPASSSRAAQGDFKSRKIFQKFI